MVAKVHQDWLIVVIVLVLPALVSVSFLKIIFATLFFLQCTPYH